MATQILLSTTGTSAQVIIEDLGRIVFTHPVVNYDLVEQITGGGFTFEDVKYSGDLQAAIDGGTIVITDENGNVLSVLKDELSVDIKVKTSSADTTPGYLNDKVTVTLGKISKVITTPGGNEKLNLTIGADIFDKTVDTSDNVTVGTTNFFLSSDEKDGLTNASSPLSSTNAVLVEDDKGVANGVATLDGTGKIPTSQLPAEVFEDMSYLGAWDASTNTPSLTSGVGTNGDTYKVSVSGSTNLDGITDWVAGDLLIFNGTLSVWEKVDGTDAVFTVNGQVGTVLIGFSDLDDAATGAPADGDVWVWNSISGEWEHQPLADLIKPASKHTFVCGRNANQNNGYLPSESGIFSNEGPFLCDRNLNIESIKLTRDGTGNEWRAEVHVNGSLTPVATLTMLAAESTKYASFNVDLNAGDTVAIYLLKGAGGSGSGDNILKPQVRLVMQER